MENRIEHALESSASRPLRIRKIPGKAKANPIQAAPKKLRAAAYARVSTDYDEQIGSFETQVAYYTDLINANPEWTFVRVYADEGVTGTSTRNRTGFNAMIEDAMAGKIDLILTKSISRFARNTVDTLSNVRRLKDRNVEVRFEKEHISSFDPNGELLLTILSSLSQEESRNISENIKWSIDSYFAKGNIMLGYKHFLGYERGADNRPRIVEEQAEVVREIYRLFLTGCAYARIARILTERGVPTPSGKNSKWNPFTVQSILKNEKYCGNAKLHKYYVPNFLDKRLVPNDGARPQYFVENSHDAIVSKEIYERVQYEIARRASIRNGQSGGLKSVLSRRVFCGDCGGVCTSRIMGRSSKNERVVWRCRQKNERSIDGEGPDGGIIRKTAACRTPAAEETQIYRGFMDTVNSLLTRKEAVMAEYRARIAALKDTGELERARAQCEAEIAESKAALDAFAMSDKVRAINAGCVDAAQRLLMGQYGMLTARVEAAELAREAVEAQFEQRRNARISLEIFASCLERQDALLTQFDKDLWVELIERVVIREGRADGCVNPASDDCVGVAEYYYKDGRMIRWAIQ